MGPDRIRLPGRGAVRTPATASRPTAVLTGLLHVIAGHQAHSRPRQAADGYDMIRVGLDQRPLTATAALAWSGDLPRHLQQVLFDTADGIPPRGFLAAAS